MVSLTAQLVDSTIELSIIHPTNKPKVLLSNAYKELDLLQESSKGNPTVRTLRRVISEKPQTPTSERVNSTAVVEGRRFYYRGKMYDISVNDLQDLRDRGYRRLIPKPDGSIHVSYLRDTGVTISHLERCISGSQRFWAEHIRGRETIIRFLEAFKSNQLFYSGVETLEKDHFPAPDKLVSKTSKTVGAQTPAPLKLEKDHFPALPPLVILTSKDYQSIISRLDLLQNSVDDLLSRPICSGGKQFYRDNYVPEGSFIDYMFNTLDKLINSEGHSAESAYRTLVGQAMTEGSEANRLYSEYTKGREKKDLTVGMVKSWYKKFFERGRDGKVHRRSITEGGLSSV